MSQASALSQEVWQLIFEFLPLADRLGSCSLVCHKFHAAAVAATHWRKCDIDDQERADAVMTWLQHHGHVVTSLELDMEDATLLLDLPCQHLQNLELTSCDVQLGAAGQSPGVLQHCATCLTRLVLGCCSVVDHNQDGEVGSALAQLVDLRHLELYCNMGPCMGNVEGAAQESFMKFPGEALLTLTRLTYLELDSVVTDQHLQHISCLQALHGLHLDLSSCPPGTVAPGFYFPACLQHLKVHSSDYDIHSLLHPDLLSSLTNLTSLDVEHVKVLDSAAFLAVLTALQQLQSLRLNDVHTRWTQASAAYSALTASRHLTGLVMSQCDLPQGIWQHMFTAGRVLPCLCSITIDRCGSPAYALSPADLSRLISACPGLVSLRCHLPQHTRAAVLAQLSGLTHLELNFNGGAQHCTMCVPDLTGLTSLQILQLHAGGDAALCWADLLPLTALRQLTYLAQGSSYLDQLGLMTSEKVGLDSTPDVWLQLLGHCAAEQRCQPSIIRALGKQLAQQEARSAQLEQQRASTQQEIGVLQQQSSAARAEAAELRQQLQMLQGQVQQLLAHLGGQQPGV